MPDTGVVLNRLFGSSQEHGEGVQIWAVICCSVAAERESEYLVSTVKRHGLEERLEKGCGEAKGMRELTLTVLSNDHEETLLFAPDGHHRDERLRGKTVSFEQLDLEWQAGSRVTAVDVDVGLCRRLSRIVVDNFGQVEVLFGRSLVDDLESLGVVRVVHRGPVDDRSIPTEGIGGKSYRGDELVAYDDAHLGGCGGSGRGGSEGDGSTYRCEWVRGSRWQGILNVLWHSDSWERRRWDLGSKNGAGSSPVHSETLDTAVGVHLYHDVRKGSRVSIDEREKVSSPRTELCARKQSDPLRIRRWNSGRVVDGTENLGGFREIAKEVGCVHFSI